MNFSIIFWNIWLTNQIENQDAQQRLFASLDRLIARYNPDCFGMNEVIMKQSGEALPAVLDYLQKRGYTYNYFLSSGPWKSELVIGDAVASKVPFSKVEGIILGAHFNEAGKDREGGQAKALKVRFSTMDIGPLDVVITHLMHLRPHTLKTHYLHQENLMNHVHASLKDGQKDIILGGDFNEFIMMPASFSKRMEKVLHSRTGNATNPTWYRNAKKNSIVRANPDKVFWSKAGRLQLGDFEIAAEYSSDHRPLYAEFYEK